MAEAKKEHKLKFSLNGAWPESLSNFLEPQIKQQQEPAQKLKTSSLLHGMVVSSHALQHEECSSHAYQQQ